MRNYNEASCEQLDAALFSGDDFLEAEERNELKEYIERWTRRIKEIEEMENQEVWHKLVGKNKNDENINSICAVSVGWEREVGS